MHIENDQDEKVSFLRAIIGGNGATEPFRYNLKILSIGSNPVAITLTIIAFFLFHETNEEKNKT